VKFRELFFVLIKTGYPLFSAIPGTALPPSGPGLTHSGACAGSTLPIKVCDSALTFGRANEKFP
jgi:hypothetical protein